MLLQRLLEYSKNVAVVTETGQVMFLKGLAHNYFCSLW